MAYCPLQIKWKISPALKQQPLHHAAQLDSVSIPSELNRTGIVAQVPRCPLMWDVGFIYWRRHFHALGKSYLLALNHPCRNNQRKPANISRKDLGLNRARQDWGAQRTGGQDRFGSQGWGKPHLLGWRRNPACRAPWALLRVTSTASQINSGASEINTTITQRWDTFLLIFF